MRTTRSTYYARLLTKGRRKPLLLLLLRFWCDPRSSPSLSLFSFFSSPPSPPCPPPILVCMHSRYLCPILTEPATGNQFITATASHPSSPGLKEDPGGNIYYNTKRHSLWNACVHPLFGKKNALLSTNERAALIGVGRSPFFIPFGATLHVQLRPLFIGRHHHNGMRNTQREGGRQAGREGGGRRGSDLGLCVRMGRGEDGSNFEERSGVSSINRAQRERRKEEEEGGAAGTQKALLSNGFPLFSLLVCLSLYIYSH